MVRNMKPGPLKKHSKHVNSSLLQTVCDKLCTSSTTSSLPKLAADPETAVLLGFAESSSLQPHLDLAGLEPSQPQLRNQICFR